MSEKSFFRRPFHKQHDKRDQTILQFARQHRYHIYWSLWTKFSWEKSILVLWKILRLFVNTLTADDKYSPPHRDNLTQHIQTLISQKQKTFSQIFSAFLRSASNFEHFEWKRWPSWAMYFPNYELRNRGLDKCLKKPVSEDPSTSSMVKAGPNTFAILTTASLPYLLITGNIIQLEKVYFSAIQNLKTVS